MRRLLSLLATLMLVASLATAGGAHAMERIGCIDASSLSIGHAEGDRDQVPSDDEKGYPHHHGSCQGHQIAAPFEEAPGFGPHAGAVPVAARSDRFSRSPATDPAPRPPQA